MKAPNDIKQRNSGGLSLGQFLRSRERMVFNSCDAGMRPNPFDPFGPMLPYVPPGTSDNRFRNELKRIARGKPLLRPAKTAAFLAKDLRAQAARAKEVA